MRDVDLEYSGINTHLVLLPKGIARFIGRAASLNSKYNPCHKYGNLITSYIVRLLLNEVRKLKKSGYHPDVIIFEWTQMLLLVDEIKQIWDVPFIASEYDVTYLGALRRAIRENGALKRKYETIKYNNVKKRELCCLSKCAYVFPHNIKDKKLIVKDGLDKSS